MKSFFWSNLLRFGSLLLVLTACSPFNGNTSKTLTAHSVIVNNVQWGQSTCYIGAVEGSSGFNITDLKDLGINTYHIYGGMPRWETQDDSSIYGSPSIAQIKANPDVINWSRWDSIMTNPPDGSDYWWTNTDSLWSGNARSLFSSLKAANIRPIVTLRNRDNQQNPSWAPNPPKTQADWNEWWEHVFATVYWLNVRNNYDVNDFEIANEPNLPSQGWTGTQSQYVSFHSTHIMPYTMCIQHTCLGVPIIYMHRPPVLAVIGLTLYYSNPPLRLIAWIFTTMTWISAQL